jgi:hypothetical protein
MMKRRFSWMLALLLTGLPPALAEEKTAEVYPVGPVDFEAAENLAKAIVSEDGKLVADKANNRLILLDYKNKHAAMRELMKKLKPETKHVRIRVSSQDSGSSSFNSVDLDGRVRAGPVVVQTPGHQGSSSTLTMTGRRGAITSDIAQDVLVISGGKAHIRVGTDVPYADWMWGYGLQQGWWTGSVQWKEVGTQMVVEPYVMGNQIRVRLTPEFSYLLSGKTMLTSVEKLTTEVTVADGQEIELGGLPIQDKEFYNKFLIGYTAGGERRSLRIKLRATIEDLTPMRPAGE